MRKFAELIEKYTTYAGELDKLIEDVKNDPTLLDLPEVNEVFDQAKELQQDIERLESLMNKKEE